MWPAVFGTAGKRVEEVIADMADADKGAPDAQRAGTPNRPEGPDESWPDGQTFEDASHHGRSVQPGPRGVKSAAPQNGAAALRNSYGVSDSAPRRIGVDLANKEIVVLDRTKEGCGMGTFVIGTSSPRPCAAL